MTMSGFDPIATAALTQAVDFLFDQAGKILEERREARKARGEVVQGAHHKGEITKKSEVQTWSPKEVYLKDIPQEIRNQLDQIHLYRTNLRNLELQIANYGGFVFAPIITQNQLRATEIEITNGCQKLKDLIESAYGHKIVVVGLH
jgi:hypothetical protein